MVVRNRLFGEDSGLLALCWIAALAPEPKRSVCNFAKASLTEGLRAAAGPVRDLARRVPLTVEGARNVPLTQEALAALDFARRVPLAVDGASNVPLAHEALAVLRPPPLSFQRRGSLTGSKDRR